MNVPARISPPSAAAALPAREGVAGFQPAPHSALHRGQDPRDTAPLLIGHRGAAAFAPENTLASLREAIARGVDMIEIDLRLSRDGEVVVFHDEYLERLTPGRGAVGEHTAGELARLPVKGGPDGIPRLADALDLVAPARVALYLEIKDPAALPGTIAAVRARAMEARCAIGAFDHAVLLAAAESAPELGRIAIIEGAPVNLRDVLLAARATHLAIGLAALCERAVREARAAGCGVYVWTVDDPRDAARCIALGVDGIVTNRPETRA
jgi:glycerophosphoryl diester phosphodiesterase